MSTTKTLSVVIPTFNCGLLLECCLKSVKWADEIIVVDMGSIDDTVNIAKKYGATIYKRYPKRGNFDFNRKFGMKKATSDWILKLDSDEVLEKPLQEEIQKFLLADNGAFDGINLYNKFFIFGKEIKHGFVYPEAHELRIVRKGKWKYEPYRLHQQITVEGKIGFVKGFYDHFNYRTTSEFISKMNKYTDLDAPYLTSGVKIDTFNIVFSFPKSFFKFFVLNCGFLDGVVGIASCTLFALYYLVERIKVLELKIKK